MKIFLSDTQNEEFLCHVTPVRENPDHALFVSDLKANSKKKFFGYYFLKVRLHNSSKKKSHKEVTKQ